MEETITTTGNSSVGTVYLTPRLKDVWTFRQRLHRAILLLIGNEKITLELI